jgi:hypothetical protein
MCFIAEPCTHVVHTAGPLRSRNALVLPPGRASKGETRPKSADTQQPDQLRESQFEIRRCHYQ